MFPFALFLYMTRVAPRPYYVRAMDIEPDYYYNALLLSQGRGPASIHHPGVPIYYLGSTLLSWVGTDLDQTQAFFRLAYLVVALATAAAILFFCRICLPGIPPVFGLLSVSLLLAWRPFLTYQDFFGADSFILAAGLPTLALIWRVLEGRAPHPLRDLLLAGMGLGVGLSVKMSFLPVALAIGIATTVWSLGSPSGAPSRRARVAGLFGMIATAITAFLLMTLPILGDLPEALSRSLQRGDTRLPPESFLVVIPRQFAIALKSSPPAVLFVAACILGLAYFGFQGLTNRFHSGRKRPSTGILSNLPDPGAILVALLLGALMYTIVVSYPADPFPDPGVPSEGHEAGVRLRNGSPSALVLPFLVLFLVRRLPPRTLAAARESRRWVWSLAVMSLIIVGWPVVSHMSSRAHFIRERLETIVQTQRQLPQPRSPDGRVAFWTGASTDYLGEASFHFWGNFRYARDAFDAELLERFPKLTFFRGARLLRDSTLPPKRVNRQPSQFGRLGNLARELRARKRMPEKTTEMFIGEEGGVCVEKVLIPTAEATVELRGIPIPFLPGLLSPSLVGPVRMSETQYGPVRWLVLDSGASPPRSPTNGDAPPGASRGASSD